MPMRGHTRSLYFFNNFKQLEHELMNCCTANKNAATSCFAARLFIYSSDRWAFQLPVARSFARPLTSSERVNGTRWRDSYLQCSIMSFPLRQDRAKGNLAHGEDHEAVHENAEGTDHYGHNTLSFWCLECCDGSVSLEGATTRRWSNVKITSLLPQASIVSQPFNWKSTALPRYTRVQSDTLVWSLFMDTWTAT